MGSRRSTGAQLRSKAAQDALEVLLSARRLSAGSETDVSLELLAVVVALKSLGPSLPLELAERLEMRGSVLRQRLYAGIRAPHERRLLRRRPDGRYGLTRRGHLLAARAGWIARFHVLPRLCERIGVSPVTRPASGR